MIVIEPSCADAHGNIGATEKISNIKDDKFFNPCKRSVCGTGKPDLTSQNAASDQSLHCLLSDCSIKI